MKQNTIGKKLKGGVSYAYSYVKQLMFMLSLSLMGCSAVAVDYGCSTIWDKSNSVLKDIYTNIMKLVTPVAGTMFIIAVAVTFFSKNQRKVETASDWAKRILIAYLIIMAVGWIFQLLQNLTSDAPNTIFGVQNLASDAPNTILG